MSAPHAASGCGPHCEYDPNGLGKGKPYQWHCSCSQCHGK